jgi:hypothetical protein
MSERDSELERRTGEDRRQKHIPFYKLLFFKGNRQELRRNDDRNRITVLDYYHPTLLVFIMIVLSLSLLDAAFTLMLLEKGAVELNPVMQFYIALGPVTFVIVKYGLTVLALVIIVVLHAIISARYRFGALILPFCSLAFGSVVIWELYLLAQ